ncbi:MAG: GNAT family N-acetyltransferase/peptidase C39 family protein [Gammaproteobacteria bacterium]|nr:GNAT family N-acetyltransferase/peptidase C39 family protein [Gammaproteobacteria bacterium]
MLRPATLQDLDFLVEIENRCFEIDRLSRRNFRHLLTKGNASTWLYIHDEVIIGYVMLLFNKGTSLARLYSIATLPEAQGKGVGRSLVEAAEKVALDNVCAYMRLEIRTDNQASINLFKKLGYRQFGTYEDYYEDHTDALRFEKMLVVHTPANLLPVPHYQQTLDFTCGPASLLMAMKTLDPECDFSRTTELRLWRESTTIFMTSGHGGCGPFGMALAAFKRGFRVELFASENEGLFVDSVRNPEKKEVIRLVNEDFLQEIKRKNIPLSYAKLTIDEIKSKLDSEGIPLILISSYRIYQEKFPHWVVVTGLDDRFIYVHDPFIDWEMGKTFTDCINMPIPIKEFIRMSRYGRSGQRAALILFNSPK